jgi:energy-coupling factor transporter ATP-binding protein EcfA2
MSTAVEPREIVIENVGPVKKVSIQIPADGGIVVLRGRNGAGKSHVLDAVQSLVSGEGSVPVRDGQQRATVDGLGATLKVSKRATRSGELEVVALDGGVDPSTLVDPGISDPDKADAQRIKALLTLARAEAKAEQFDSLVPGRTLSQFAADETDPVRLAAIAKRAYQALARDSETAAEVARREAESHRAAVVQIDYEGPTDPKVLRANLEQATRAEMALEATVAANEAAIIRANEALAKVRQLSDGHADKLAAARADNVRYEAVLAERAEDLDRLAKALEIARAEHEESRRTRDESGRTIRELEAAGKTIESLEAEVDKAAGIVPVDPAQIEAAGNAVHSASEAVRLAELVRQSEQSEAKAKAAAERAKASESEAQKARDAAAQCDKILSGLVDAAGTGLFVDGGRLRLSTDRGDEELYADLSHGERWRIAIDVCVASVGACGLIVIPQEAWEGLDPVSRTELSQHCRERGVTVLTAECDACEMTAEVV